MMKKAAEGKVKKYSNKNTAKELLTFLDHVVQSPVLYKHLDKAIRDRIAYTKKAIEKKEKVLKSDLVVLCNDIMEDLTKKEKEIAKDAVQWAKSSKKETEPKPEPEKEPEKKKKPAKKQASEKKTEQEPEKKPEKTEKKAAEKQEKAKPESKPAKKPKQEKPESAVFIEQFQDDDGMFYTLDDSLRSYAAIKKAVAEGTEVVIATLWTKARLNTGLYGNGQIAKKSDMPKKFDNDLDILSPVYVPDKLANVICVSLYTECEYWFRDSELKKGVSNNLDCRVYRVTNPKENEGK